MISSAMIKPTYVTDANALYWYLTDDKRLSKAARDIFSAAEQGQTQIVISVIAMAEIYYIQQKSLWIKVSMKFIRT